MHLHGYKMEILDVHAPKFESSCNLAKCNLSNYFNSTKKMRMLESIPKASRPKKDTFILPAGGAVATRIFTREPAYWFAHCHMEVHRQDGMAFIMNVGDYHAPLNESWLPDDFPRCDTAFHISKANMEPYCNCYIDKDAVLGLTLDETYKCSREYNCMWEQSQVALLRDANNRKSFKLQSTYPTEGWIISLAFAGCVIFVTLIFTTIFPRRKIGQRKNSIFHASDESCPSIQENCEEKASFLSQFRALLLIRWHEYRPTTINILRVIEVMGLGLITGFLFKDVGRNSTITGFGEKTSLLFFSTTLWCQTRMYPAISNYFEFKQFDRMIMKENRYDVLPIWLSRLVVVTACEVWWPFLFVFLAYPLASMFGCISKVLRICLFLAMNNICYIAIGGFFGTLMPTVNLGMIGATLFAQSTVICAGFFTQLPFFLGWIRFISPIFYAFKGIVKSAYNWDDTFQCPKGDAASGATQCFMELNTAIDDYKQRGINVATLGDPTSSNIYVEAINMFILFSFCQLFVLYRLSNGNTLKRKCADHPC